MRKSIFARSALSAVAFLLLAAGLCDAQNRDAKKRDYRVALAFDQGKPVIGTNRITVTVTDDGSKPVTGAQVKVDYFMPSLRGKPPMMKSSTKATPVKGAYEAVLQLSMKGEWRVVVSVAALGRATQTTFAYEVW